MSPCCYAYMHSGSHGGSDHIVQEFPNDPLNYDKETELLGRSYHKVSLCCYAYMHSGSHGGGDDIVQEFPNDPLNYDKETQSYLVEAIIR